jgi:serine/threonine protein kinase
MTLASGIRLGPYEILAPLGAGGMGEVYRARDTRLDRAVAIKVLPAHLSDNPELRQRFEREARAVSSLQHPHICTLHDVGQQDGIDYLVMEYIDGQSLADRLAKGSLPTQQVLRYAIEIADALDRAHRVGITHRDLKPGNVMLTKSGAKLLDFGLAKFRGSDSSLNLSLTSLPTERRDITAEGAILGTFQYMAPEQLEGREADARTDIFAFGAVVYEMATGKKAFTGQSQASLIGAILHKEPQPISTIQPMTPPALDRVVKQCLAKDPDERWQSAHDLMNELKWISDSGSEVSLPESVVAHRKSRERMAWITAIVLLLALLAALPFVIAYFSRPTTRQNVVRSIMSTPENAHLLSFNNMAVSPDGLRLAFVAIGANGVQSLWLRPLGALSAQPLAGTEGAISPFWSPDSRFIGFFANGKLKKIDAAGGSPQTLCPAPNGRGGTWNRDGAIVFAPDILSPLYRVPQGGGAPAPLPLDQSRNEKVYHFPYFLPDGRHFLYRAGVTTAYARDKGNGIYAGSLDSSEYKLILNDDTYAIYASGHLLFWRDGALMAQPFDVESLQLSGEAVPIAEQVQMNLSEVRASFSVSENGVLVFQRGTSVGAVTQLTWFERDGKQAGKLGEPAFGASPNISPDGQRVAAMLFDIQAGSTDLWLYDSTLARKSRFTFDPAFDTSPIWSPDGRSIAFCSDRKARLKYNLYLKDANGARDEDLLFESDEYKRPTSWSADGHFLAYTSSDGPSGKGDIWIFPFSGERKPFQFTHTAQFDEQRARFSPNGRFVAYDSDESGSRQVYVTSFPGPGGKLQVSTNGGEDPVWRRDGKELFFLFEGKLMAAEVKANGSGVDIGNAQLLFDAHSGFGPYAHYDVTPDGKRFLVATVGEGRSAPMNLVLNWTADLKR